METHHSWKSFIAQGRAWRAVAEWSSEFFDRIEDEQYDDYDAYPLREDVRAWLDKLPRGRWWVESPDGTGLIDITGPRWMRPIYFRFRRDLMLFKLRWDHGAK